MERISLSPRFYSVGFGLFLVFSLLHCSSNAYSIKPEPTLEQVTSQSEEICIGTRFYFFSGRPCISVKGEKDNNSGQVQYYFRYEIGTFDVDLPLGVSLKVGDTWYNLKKSSTDYSNTIVVSSHLPPEVTAAIGSGKSFVVSYTNRSGTENFPLNGTQVSRLQDNLLKLQKQLESEQKMKIQK
ncbi:hypothetical protein [Leptospira idonii]|uniref:Uncharacterized protein n=1 Tax=Leptospira idonii TaxID=1193500 RepID=A0A4R9LVX7_9LEPT|nr:hypothetical protein [Leptospira idonii]TGN18414.1 hypothetical protein EHS15_13530 [Leptospira idonii]